MRTGVTHDLGEARAARAAQLLWQRLADAGDAAAYCQAWLALQVAEIDRVGTALLLLKDDSGAYVPAAVWPDAQADVAYLGGIAQRCLVQRGAVSERTQDEPGRLHAAYPLEAGGEWLGAVVLDLAPRGDPELQQVWRALHWGSGRIETLLLRRRLEERAAGETRMRLALDLALGVGEEARFDAALLRLANELAGQLGVERVAIGLERRGRIRLLALSNAANFERRAEFAVALENAMEEACDQGRSVAYPPAGAPGAVAVAHRHVAGQGWACSVGVTLRGRCIGAISCLSDTPRDAETVAALEAAAALVAPNLGLRRDLRRWFAGRTADGVRAFGRGLRDPRRLSFRVGTALVVALLAWLGLATSEYRVTGRAVIEGELQRTVAAPFDGFIATSGVRAGQRVAAGDLLASLDDRDLRLDLQKWHAQGEQAERKYRDALAKRDAPNARILAAQLAEAQAHVALVEDKIARASIVAPFDGVLVSGDLSQMLGAPIEKGHTLFELAPLDAYRVILKVPERAIREVRSGQHGVIVLSGRSTEKIRFTVDNIGVPVAEEGENLFRVEASLDEGGPGLRPGMEGVGKISIDERRLLWIWTHAFFDWLRVKLWYWMP
jgi:hypothetical protein